LQWRTEKYAGLLCGTACSVFPATQFDYHAFRAAFITSEQSGAVQFQRSVEVEGEFPIQFGSNRQWSTSMQPQIYRGGCAVERGVGAAHPPSMKRGGGLRCRQLSRTSASTTPKCAAVASGWRWRAWGRVMEVWWVRGDRACGFCAMAGRWELAARGDSGRGAAVLCVLCGPTRLSGLGGLR
jgi:hypothetical protein